MKKQELKKQNQEMESSLSDFIQILELDDKILRYNSLIGQLTNVKESEKYGYIAAHLKRMDNREKRYKDAVRRLSFSIEGHYDKDIIDEEDWISATIQWILDSITYKQTTEDMYSFVVNKQGQCYHVSRFFCDVLQRQGIEATLVKGYVRGQENDGLHVWNKVRLGNETKYFDITFELTKSEDCDRKWIWLSEEKIYQTHIPIYEID